MLLLLVLLSVRGMELKNMVATIPVEMFLEVLAVFIAVIVITGLLVMIIRWDMHLAAEEKVRGPLSMKHVAAGVLGMILALGITLIFAPLIVGKIVAEPAAVDYQVYGGIVAFIAAIVFVALTQFGFSKIKDFIERAGKGICDLILSGAATTEQIADAIATASPKQKKAIAKALKEREEIIAQDKILAAAAAGAAAPKEEQVL